MNETTHELGFVVLEGVGVEAVSWRGTFFASRPEAEEYSVAKAEREDCHFPICLFPVERFVSQHVRLKHGPYFK